MVDNQCIRLTVSGGLDRYELVEIVLDQNSDGLRA